ncbi:MAG: hypothetical protein ACX932_04095 [Gammaproteobacteria bacterium]
MGDNDQNKDLEHNEELLRHQREEKKRKAEQQLNQKERNVFDDGNHYATISPLNYSRNPGLFLLAFMFKYKQYDKDKKALNKKRQKLEALRRKQQKADERGGLKSGNDDHKQLYNIELDNIKNAEDFCNKMQEKAKEIGLEEKDINRNMEKGFINFNCTDKNQETVLKKYAEKLQGPNMTEENTNTNDITLSSQQP